MAEDRMLSDEVLLALIKKNSGGGGGTTNYNDLSNQPQIGGVTLIGNMSASDLGLASEDDLADKQDVLTAGDYIKFDEDEISVNREIPNETVSYELRTKGTSEPNIAIIVTKRSNGSVEWEREYQYLDVLTPINIDDVIKFGYQWVYAGQWTYEMLVASDSHAVGYRQSWGYLETRDYTEDFSLIDNTGLKLVIKSEMDTALSTKANTDMVAADFNAGSSYTAGNYCVQDGKLYKFKNNHSGAWSAADVDEIKISGELSSLRRGLTNETVLLNQLLTTTSTSYNLNGLVGDYMFVAFILGWYGNDNNDNMIVMPSSAFSCNDYLILYRNNDPATNAYAKINQRGYANGVNNIYAEGTAGVSIKVVGIIHK